MAARRRNTNPNAVETKDTVEETISIPGPPKQVAVLGRLVSVKVKTPGGGTKTVRPKSRMLATNPEGNQFYAVPQPARWDEFKGPITGAARRAAIFHNVKKVTKESEVTIPSPPKRLNVVGVVTQMDYEPIEPSPKANVRWYHKSGDLGPGHADSEVILAASEEQYYFIITERDRGYPKVTDRGIVG